MVEAWAPIPGFDGYAASSAGAIMGPRGLLSTPKTRGGYLTCSLRRDGKKTTTTVQRLVLLAFDGPPPTPEHQANHKNGNKLDNSPSNLEWLTPSENKEHARTVLRVQVGRKRKPRPADQRQPIKLDLKCAGWRDVTVYPGRGTKWRVVDDDTGAVLNESAIKNALHWIAFQIPRPLGERNLM